MIVRITDSWNVGDVAARLCVRPPASSRAHCSAVAIPAGERRTTLRFRATRAGRWTACACAAPASGRGSTRCWCAGRAAAAGAGHRRLDDPDHRLASCSSGWPAAGGRRALATRAYQTGISKPSCFDWVAHADGRRAPPRPTRRDVHRRQRRLPVRRRSVLRRGVARAYARRAAPMMCTYMRGGRAPRLLAAAAGAARRRVPGASSRGQRARSSGGHAAPPAGAVAGPREDFTPRRGLPQSIRSTAAR